MNITDFKINDMVQQKETAHGAFSLGKFNGVVVGFTVNSFGEPILSVDMTVRRLNGTTAATMVAEGYAPVDFTFGVFWHRISSIHPSNVVPFHDVTNLIEDS
jgi:hypothetical protein